VISTWDMTTDQAEQVVEEQARVFEDAKDYLLKVWEEKSKIPENQSGEWQLYD